MKVLVATARTQGEQEGDFCHAIEGELVMHGTVCDAGQEGACDCGRSLVGVKSLKSTTTFMVSDLDITEDELAAHLIEAFEASGASEGMTDDDVREATAGEVRELTDAAAAFAAGSVLEIRGEEYRMRMPL